MAAALEGRASSVQNTMYPGDGAAIGSVGWLPGDAQIATATSDAGRLHLFDIRTHVRPLRCLEFASAITSGFATKVR